MNIRQNDIHNLTPYGQTVLASQIKDMTDGLSEEVARRRGLEEHGSLSMHNDQVSLGSGPVTSFDYVDKTDNRTESVRYSEVKLDKSSHSLKNATIITTSGDASHTFRVEKKEELDGFSQKVWDAFSGHGRTKTAAYYTMEIEPGKGTSSHKDDTVIKFKVDENSGKMSGFAVTHPGNEPTGIKKVIKDHPLASGVIIGSFVTTLLGPLGPYVGPAVAASVTLMGYKMR